MLKKKTNKKQKSSPKVTQKLQSSKHTKPKPNLGKCKNVKERRGKTGLQVTRTGSITPNGRKNKNRYF